MKIQKFSSISLKFCLLGQKYRYRGCEYYCNDNFHLDSMLEYKKHADSTYMYFDCLLDTS